MKRAVVIVVVLAVIGAAMFFALHPRHRTAPGAALALLQADTLAVAVVPDVARARQQWHGSDVYKLWHEPTVQAFLQKPLSRAPQAGEAASLSAELDSLGARNVFIALTPVASGDWTFAGGFQFNASQHDVENFAQRWRARMSADDAAKWKTAFAGDWFLVSSDADALQHLAARAQNKSDATTLATDETFSVAQRHVGADYIGLLFARPDRLLASSGNAVVQQRASTLQQMHSFAVAVGFEGGRVRERAFIAMPRTSEGELTRKPLQVGNSDTWAYLGMLLNVAALFGPDAANPIPLVTVLNASGITADDWRNAFSDEIGFIGDWPVNSRWPVLFVAVPVKDAGRAQAITEAVATALHWSTREQNGVRYVSIPAGGQMFAIEPTLAVSDKMLVLGLGPESVQAVMHRVEANEAGLAGERRFQQAQSLVSPATTASAFLDLSLLYTRLDAALRPMLVMSAAFMPALNDAIDLSKLPPPETITRHLSPIVFSQRYEDGGYVSESVGPVGLSGGIIGTAALGGGAVRMFPAARSAASQLQVPGAVAGPTPSATPR